MLHLLVRLGPQAGWRIEAVTVNHGLRPEAQAEAEYVADACARIDVPHAILNWQRSQTTGNLMDQASRARRQLIAQWADERGIGHVALGHTVDDQAETFMMRLARQSGVDGLSAMRQSWLEQGIIWVRPLIYCYRAELRNFLRRAGQSWIEDPTNDDPAFDRAKVRRTMPVLADIGVSGYALSHVARHMATARDALDDWTSEVAAKIMRIDLGDVVFDRAGLVSAHPEVRRRLLLRALGWISSSDYPPRADKWGKLEQSIVGGRSHSLMGCLVLASQDNIRVTRELDAVRTFIAQTDAIWDNRWQLSGLHDPLLQIRALGETGLQSCPDWRATGFPRTSLLSSPAVWQGDRLIAAPLAGFNEAWQARIVADFHSSLLSH